MSDRTKKVNQGEREERIEAERLHRGVAVWERICDLVCMGKRQRGEGKS